MTIAWCAVAAYVFCPLVLAPLPGGPLWRRVLLGLQNIASSLSWAGLAMCGVVVLSAVLLRRWPLPALGLLLAAAITAASAPQPPQSIACFLNAPAGVAVGFIAATRPRRISLAAAVIALGVLARYGTNWSGDGFTAGCWPVAVVIAWLIGHSVRQHRQHAEMLRAQAEAGAVTAERLRVAGELHDMVAHAIGVIAIQAGAGRRVIGTEPAQARDALAAIEAISRQTLAGVRRTLGLLRGVGSGHEPGQAPPGPAPAPAGATPGPPLLRRVLPGVSMGACWCAVTAYAIISALMPNGAGLIALPGAWPVDLLAMTGVVLASAVLLRRWPLPALGLLLVGGIAAARIPGPQLITEFQGAPQQPPVFFLIPPAGVAVGCIAATRPRPASIGAAVIALGVLARYARGGVPLGFPGGTSPVLAAAVTIVIGWLAGQSIRAGCVHAEALRAQGEVEVVTAERLRIARELHDVVAHGIGVIAIQAGAGGRVINTQPAVAADALAAIEATSRQALAGLRRTLGAPRGAGPGPALAPSSLDLAPGLADLGRLAATAMGAGVRVDVRWRGRRRPLPGHVDLSAFRIIQEAVTNVVRHAGTSHCQVTIDQRDDQVAIEVTDNGRGGTADGTGYGITGMRERAGLLGGQLSAGPRPEGGFAVAARLPLPVPAAVR
jgi:signal transduction histidine kinase